MDQKSAGVKSPKIKLQNKNLTENYDLQNIQIIYISLWIKRVQD
jgi:hypothetical protein